MHALIDLETLSTHVNGVILQIGAVLFEPVAHGKIETADAFNCYVSITGQPRHVDHSTFVWWLQQGKATVRLAQGLRDESVLLRRALQDLGLWHKKYAPEAVWAHGSHFDIAILNDAYAGCGLETPWSYRDIRDTRTLYTQCPVELVDGHPDPVKVAARIAPLFRDGMVRHHALHDAIEHAAAVQVAMESLT